MSPSERLAPHFPRAAPPTDADVAELVEQLARRITHHLQRQGRLPRAPARIAETLLVDEREKLRPRTLCLRAVDWDEDRAIPLEERMARTDIVAALEPELRKGRLVLLDVEGRIAAWKAVASSGGAVLATFDVPQGRYGLRFDSDQMIEALDDLCVTAGGVERVELTLGARRHVLGTLRLPDRIDASGARPWIAIESADGRRRFVSNFEPEAQVDIDALLENGPYVLTARYGQRQVTRELVVDGPATFVSVSFDE